MKFLEVERLPEKGDSITVEDTKAIIEFQTPQNTLDDDLEELPSFVACKD